MRVSIPGLEGWGRSLSGSRDRAVVLTEEPASNGFAARLVPGWRERYGVIAGITVRDTSRPGDFSMALGADPDRGVGYGNRAALLRELGGLGGGVMARQIAGSEVLWHTQQVQGWRICEEADGHGTAVPGLLLAVTVADCIPVYLLDPVVRVVMLLHVGWRGLSCGILNHGLDKLIANGSAVENIVMHCGVGISGSRYEVGSDVAEACGISGKSDNKVYLDIRQLLFERACECGIRTISTSPFCSADSTGLFFSHRRSRGDPGRMMAFIGLWPEQSAYLA